MFACPLCDGRLTGEFYRGRSRVFYRCRRCSLVFADPASHLSPEAEKARYLEHHNHSTDPGYRKFLSRLALPLAKRLGNGGQAGLDFGSGPGPTLSLMLEEMGYRMTVYDPYFAPNPKALTRQYDFITCTEVVEHFRAPGREWQLLLGMLKPGGWLAIMTKLVRDAEAFANWHYRQDRTHVSFFSRETFQYLAGWDQLEIEFVASDVIFFRQPAEKASEGS